MSPAIITASTPWSRNHSSVWMKVVQSLGSYSPLPSFERRTCTSLTTPKRSFGVPSQHVPVKMRQPLNAPRAPKAPPMKNLRETFIVIPS